MKSIQPGRFNGVIRAPSSKSMMQRAVAIACLAEGPTTISFPSLCDDGKASLDVAKALGATIVFESEVIRITPGKIKAQTLHCGESGTSFRIFAAIAALFEIPLTLEGEGSLKKRPMNMVTDALKSIGVSCVSNNSYLPLTITGPLRGGTIVVDGSESSQFVSGLLIALPKVKADTILKVTNLKSKPYVSLTLSCVEKFGGEITSNPSLDAFSITGGQLYRGTAIELEGDWSGAAFPLVAGAIGGSVTVQNLSVKSLQGDKAILDIIKTVGATVRIESNSIKVEVDKLNPFQFDATDCPDLFPPLVVLASYCDGESTIKGISRLIHKESNRAFALVNEFQKLGIKIVLDDNLMKIQGGTPIQGGAVSTHSDHRIAMACSIAAIGAKEPVTLDEPKCVDKSYPEFFNHLSILQGAA